MKDQAERGLRRPGVRVINILCLKNWRSEFSSKVYLIVFKLTKSSHLGIDVPLKPTGKLTDSSPWRRSQDVENRGSHSANNLCRSR